VVVLRGGDEEAVGFPDRLLEARDRLGIALRLDVLVVEGDLADLEDVELHSWRHFFLGGAQERPVVGGPAEAPGKTQEGQVPAVFIVHGSGLQDRSRRPRLTSGAPRIARVADASPDRGDLHLF
jgi:hypothetical protein